MNHDFESKTNEMIKMCHKFAMKSTKKVLISCFALIQKHDSIQSHDFDQFPFLSLLMASSCVHFFTVPIQSIANKT